MVQRSLGPAKSIQVTPEFQKPFTAKKVSLNVLLESIALGLKIAQKPCILSPKSSYYESLEPQGRRKASHARPLTLVFSIPRANLAFRKCRQSRMAEPNLLKVQNPRVYLRFRVRV